jgi:hypothetical protein
VCMQINFDATTHSDARRSAGEPQALYGKWFASLSAPTAFTFGADLLAQYESSGAGASWDTILADPFPMAAVIGCVGHPERVFLLAARAVMNNMAIW